MEFTSNETKRKQRISGVPKFQKAQVDLLGDNSYRATEMMGEHTQLADFWLNMRCSFCPGKWKTEKGLGAGKLRSRLGARFS